MKILPIKKLVLTTILGSLMFITPSAMQASAALLKEEKDNSQTLPSKNSAQAEEALPTVTTIEDLLTAQKALRAKIERIQDEDINAQKRSNQAAMDAYTKQTEDFMASQYDWPKKRQ